jgi:glycosyltransferase involved in cell wall biosynthesis
LEWFASHAGRSAPDSPGAGGAPAPGVDPCGVLARIGGAGPHYSGDLVGDAERYARLVVALARNERFDVIHAHDWLTFPAGLAMARVSGKPLVVHVHSTEFDRSGDHVHQPVYDIERRGMHGAQRVIAVSMLTKSLCISRYGVRAGKVDVVYNGIDRESEQPRPGMQIASADKIVLFLGRITMQKGPEYFIGAAKRVLEKYEDVKFVVAGSGDMATRMIELAAHMGIGHKVLFTGFLRGRDVDRIFRMADCYVMPSVSEPFGIAPLEAIDAGVPVIISKQSGVSEVLTHVLKVDFWDTDEMANKIVAVLRHPPLSATLRHHGSFELRRLTWEGAAQKCVESYRRAAEALRPVRG